MTMLPNTAPAGKVRGFARTFVESVPTADASWATGAFACQVQLLSLLQAVIVSQGALMGFQRTIFTPHTTIHSFLQPLPPNGARQRNPFAHSGESWTTANRKPAAPGRASLDCNEWCRCVD